MVPVAIYVIILKFKYTCNGYITFKTGYIFKQAKICENFVIWVPIEVLCICIQYSIHFFFIN